MRLDPEYREYLYGDQGWSMERIAIALDVSNSTISTDLANFPAAGKVTAKDGTKRGRPKKNPTVDVAHPEVAEGRLRAAEDLERDIPEESSNY